MLSIHQLKGLELTEVGIMSKKEVSSTHVSQLFLLYLPLIAGFNSESTFF